MTIFNYTLNYVDVAFVLVALFAAITGYLRGIFSTIIRLIRAAVGLLLCFYCSSHFTQHVYDSLVKPRLLETINEKIVVSGNVDEIIKNLNNYIDSLPRFIGDNLSVKHLKLSSGDIAQSILKNVFEPAALQATKIGIFIAVFIVFFLVTGIIISAVSYHNKREAERRGDETKLKKADRVFGILFGLLKAFVIALAVTSIFMYIMSNDASLVKTSGFWQEVQSSSLVNMINEINPFNAITEGLI